MAVLPLGTMRLALFVKPLLSLGKSAKVPPCSSMVSGTCISELFFCDVTVPLVTMSFLNEVVRPSSMLPAPAFVMVAPVPLTEPLKMSDLPVGTLTVAEPVTFSGWSVMMVPLVMSVASSDRLMAVVPLPSAAYFCVVLLARRFTSTVPPLMLTELKRFSVLMVTLPAPVFVKAVLPRMLSPVRV